MARRVTLAALLSLAALLTFIPAQTLLAQPDGAESNIPEAGFGPPPGTTPASSSTNGIALPGNTPTPTLHVFSRETIVDVLATDDQGHPVRGLTRNDFTILEDNRPQPIRGFSESSASLPPPIPALQPDTYTNAYTLPPSGPVQIFLVERQVISSESRQGMTLRATPAARSAVSVPPGMVDYLRTMQPGTRVAIFSFSPFSGLQLVQGFTSDGNAAVDAAARIKPDIDLAPGYRGPTEIFAHLAALDQIAAYVAGIHGRKNLIWITPDMPVELVRDGGYGNARTPDMSVIHHLMDAYETFSREQIAVYPISPDGVHQLGRGSMRAQDVAEQSGGSYTNSNDIRTELTGIVEHSSDLYTISYIPPRPKEDARFHTLQIQVDRPGIHLSYRTGYDDDHPRPADGMLKNDLLQGPMRLGALPATQLLFTLHVTPAPTGAAAPRVNIVDKRHAGSAKDRIYNAVFTFDPTQIVFSEAPDGKRTAKLELDLNVFDGSSQLGPVRSQAITLTVNPSGYDDFMRKPFAYNLPVPIPGGQQTLRAGLFDTVSGKTGTLQVPLTIPKP